MEEFTEEELAEYNGGNGKPAYIAYEGRIFDVSASFLWKNGRHQALHEAGADLTEALKDAPHGEDFLRRFPVIGVLRRDGSKNV
ncbi:cytochrome B5 [Candidatus Bathyarchaeota archaeon]|nr:cytochrome B5 [Candidatus Bathyarchaeota archaeon]